MIEDRVTLGHIADDLYERTGIRVESNKLHYIEHRVEKRMKELNLERVLEYYRHLHFNRNSPEWQLFINDCTVNETYFFREFPQLQCFAEHVLPMAIKKKVDEGIRRLRIWCAACSTGEEAYTLAIILKEMIEDPHRWIIDLVATDIDSKVLATAQRGIYNARSVHDVPPEYLNKYFSTRGDSYFIGLDLKKMISFQSLNFMDEAGMDEFRQVDIIFCRNVLIYFDDDSRKKVVEKFYDALNPGGTLFLGHSESVGRITDAFKLRRLGDHLVYQKP